MRVQPEPTLEMQTRGGIALDVRPASPGDQEDLLRFLCAVKPEDLRFRFLAAVKPSEMLAHILSDVDHETREDLVAFDARDRSVVASAMIAPGHAPDYAEIAVLVRSDAQERGVGWAMLQAACAYAQRHGFKCAECVESSENRRAMAVEREQGFVARLHPEDAKLTILTKVLS